MLRSDRLSLGLPIACLFALLMAHVPGAFVHLIGGPNLIESDLIESGIRLTAIGVVCFVSGVWLARFPATEVPAYRAVNRRQFWYFCVIAGWLFTLVFSSIGRIPTLSAVLDKGGTLWMLGVLLGLRSAFAGGDVRSAGLWFGVLAVYPLLMVLFGGFLSYGSVASIVVVSVLAISTRSPLKVVVGIILALVISLSIFVTWFKVRGDIREVAWSGAPLEERIDASLNLVRDFEWFDPSNQAQQDALDQRLNQNYFIGLAERRIQEGEVDYLYGRSLWEGVLSLVPRFLWPEKTVFGGSPGIVSEMTGLVLSESTAFGIGQVMEFQINFGVPGVVVGFLVLGWLLGTLDRKAAVAEGAGDLDRTIILFLPAVALVQPQGSMVEIVGGPVVALLAAHAWAHAWNIWSKRHAHQAQLAGRPDPGNP